MPKRKSIEETKQIHRYGFEGIFERVDVSEGCWTWRGFTTRQGYGQVREGLVHRLMFIVSGSEIPEGYELDHLCHNADLACFDGIDCLHRRCVNPDHLEAVTPEENKRRAAVHGAKTHCPRGHRYVEKNNREEWICRICIREYDRTYAARRREEAAPR